MNEVKETKMNPKECMTRCMTRFNPVKGAVNVLAASLTAAGTIYLTSLL